jgi:glycosyltransferase involved in cell wall biosynthesis
METVRAECGGESRALRKGVKIVQMISRLCVGGASTEVVLISEELLRRGYSTLLLAGEVSGEEASLEERVIAKGIVVGRIEGMSRHISWRSDLKAFWRIFEAFRRERPAIVHTHTAKAGVLGRIAARLAGVPVCVHTFHGHVFRGRFSRIKSFLFLTIEKLLARMTDCCVALSETQRRELVEEFHVSSAEHFVTIPVGHALDPLLRLSPRPRSQTPLVGWVGRMEPVKNPLLFVSAMREVHTHLASLRSVMIGDGDLRSAIEKQIENEELCGKITLPGWQAGSDLLDFYADTHMVVLSSRDEGTPLVLVEAMAAGKPFVATNVGGVPDMVCGKGERIENFYVFQNGILTHPDPSSIGNAVQFLLQNPEKAWEMGLAGRAFASRNFSQNHLGNSLERLYLHLLKQKGVHITAHS